MATKYYGINDKWTDDDVENVIEIASEDGSVNSVKVNGEDYGGGGGGETIAQVTIINNTGDELELPLVSLTSDPLGSTYTGPTYAPSGTETYTVPLYEGSTHMLGAGLNITSVTGDASISGNNVVITGDCSITIDA